MAIFKDSDSQKQTMAKTAELQARLDNHVAGDDEQQLHMNFRSEYKKLIAAINANIVDSREKSQALTELEASFMWVGKAIFKPAPNDESTAGSPDDGSSKQEWLAYTHWMFEGKEDYNLQTWLGDAFEGYSRRNVPGEFEDEIILNLKRPNGQGYAGPIRKGAILQRVGSYSEGFIIADLSGEMISNE